MVIIQEKYSIWVNYVTHWEHYANGQMLKTLLD